MCQVCFPAKKRHNKPDALSPRSNRRGDVCSDIQANVIRPTNNSWLSAISLFRFWASQPMFMGQLWCPQIPGSLFGDARAWIQRAEIVNHDRVLVRFVLRCP